MTPEEILDNWLDEWEEITDRNQNPSLEEFLAKKGARE